MRPLATLLAAAAGLAAWAPAACADPDPTDTRLLTMPAVSAKNIAFVYAEDLWVADLDGKNPRRLTSDVGVESNPVFSPDGETIAFSAQYEGNTDVYTIPLRGGSPTRLTWHPGPDTVRGFTPDGKKVLFSSPRNVYSNRHQQLFTVPLTGGMPDQLPIPWGFEASYSPGGDYIAYTPVRDASSQWKHYRGGTHGRIWVYRVKDHEVVEIPQPKGRCNDLDPNWLGETIYFRSDRAGEYNVFAYDVGTKEVRQLTQFTDFPVLDINAGGGKLIFEQAGYLHLLTPGESQPMRLKVGIAIDDPEARPRFAKGARYVRHAAVSPSGARAVVEFRGEIVTVPAEKGDPRNLTNSPGVHDRDPAWSPDGKTIAYFSDAGGEYQLVLAPQNGKGKARTVKLTGSGFYSEPVWSRDSKKLLYRDNSQSLYWLDVESGKVTKIVEPQYGRSRALKGSSWSPDSKWVAYSIDTPAQIARVYVYSVEAGKSFPVTDGLSESVEPVFDASGKYLYFLGSNDTGMSKHGFSQSSADTRSPRWSLYLAVLQKDVPSPFLRESDEEKGPEPRKAPPPRLDDEPRKAEKAEPGDDTPRPPPRKKDAAFKIDLEGIDQRILALPLPAGNYGQLQAGQANQVFYVARQEAGDGERGGRGFGPRGGALHRYDLERKRDTVVQPTVTAYELTPDGRKMLYSTGGENWFIGSATGSGSGAPSERRRRPPAQPRRHRGPGRAAGRVEANLP